MSATSWFVSSEDLGQSTGCGKTLQPASRFLIFPTHTSSSAQAGLPGTCPIWHRPAFLSRHPGPQAAWARGGGGRDAHICTGSVDWLAQAALGSRSLGISLPVPLRDRQRAWGPCFQQGLSGWDGGAPSPRLSCKCCGQDDDCPAASTPTPGCPRAGAED